MSSSIRRIGPLDVPIDDDPVLGGVAGWTVRGNTVYLGPITHAGQTGVQATPDAAMHSCIYSDALLTEARPVLMTTSAATAYDVAGFVVAMATRVDQAFGATPGSHVYPDDGAGGDGFANGGLQLKFSGLNTVSVGLSDSLFSSQIPNFVIGDLTEIPLASRRTPIVDAVNNPKNAYLYHARVAGVASIGYQEPAPVYASLLTDLASLSVFAEIGPYIRSALRTATLSAGLATLGTTGTGANWNIPDWSFGSAPVGLLGRATVSKVMNVLIMGDSVAYGAWATAGGTAPPYNCSYGWTACRQASTKDLPVNFIGTGRNSALSPAACERVRRIIRDVIVPDVVVMKPSRNDGWAMTDLLALETELLALGIWVVWVVPNPENTTSVPWNTARNTIVAKTGLPLRSVVDASQVMGNFGVDLSQWDANPGPFVTEASGIHPNLLGHAVMREGLTAVLRSLAALAAGTA